MIATLRVEVRRVLSRRLFKVLAILAVIAFLTAGTIGFFKSVPPGEGPSQVALAQQERARLVQECVEQGGFDFGERPGAPAPIGPDDIARLCDQQLPPAEAFMQRPNTFSLSSLRDALQGTAALFMIFAMVVGASSIGAEWSNRTVTTTLTWEPRRVRLAVAKILAVMLVTFAGAFVLQLVLIGVFLPAAYLRGISEVPGGFWSMLMEDVLRIGALSGLGATIGFSIATVGRSTAAALGATFFYLAVLERLAVAWRPGWRAWSIGDNMAVLLTRFSSEMPDRTMLVAGAVLVCWTLAFAAAATGFLKRADIG